MDSMVILQEALRVQNKKVRDYTEKGADQYQNFDRSASVVQWFKDPIDQVFITLIMTKISRLAALLEPGHDKPIHESIKDTFVDLTNYCSLWAGKRLCMLEHEHPAPPNKEETIFWREESD